MNEHRSNVSDSVKNKTSNECSTKQNSIRFFFEGFVRSIDMKRGEIHVVIPDETISRHQINGLIKGNDDCPDEFYFMSIDRVRFLSIESN